MGLRDVVLMFSASWPGSNPGLTTEAFRGTVWRHIPKGGENLVICPEVTPLDFFAEVGERRPLNYEPPSV